MTRFVTFFKINDRDFDSQELPFDPSVSDATKPCFFSSTVTDIMHRARRGLVEETCYI